MKAKTVPQTNHVPSHKSKEPPHTFLILFGIIVLVAIISYFIPPGEYERTINEDGQSVVVDGTYTSVEPNPPVFFDLFQAIHLGMVEAAMIIFFIFVVGGSFHVFRETKAIEGAFGSMSKQLVGRELFVIPCVMLFFGVAGASVGVFEEMLPFIMIMIPIALKMGFDSVVGAAMVLVGVASGFTAAFMNPFTIGVAQGIAELPLFSGMGVRIVFWIVFMLVSIWYVMRYAKKVRNDHTLSITYEEDKQWDIDMNDNHHHKLTKRQTAVLAVLLTTLVVLAFGVIKFGWYLTEISAVFVIMAVVMGIINGMNVNKIAKSFAEGCQEIVVGALVVGFAYGAVVILENSSTIDTILYSMVNALSEWPSSIAAFGIFIAQSLLNFIVSSGSGQAALSMPIIAPLADLIDVQRQTAVLAFQMGDGISNIFSPTSGLLLAALAMSGISWIKWIKFIWPLIIIHYALGAVFVTIVHLFIWT
ncbi:Uncharacterized membrane protein YfcC, ion transporter superfamily [Alteribacillus persepolensis]|uniref:Uncharacterized membrane protein YfcC, ion transporter superfamily n=1 Tax=Alteribacillus persepolensis TaxID=568899 RepID=A0A1G8F4N6_9BACI|nr:TIGR00366 family protein [Alteribacillus persepolensis]SDH76959.1 Uncharacterized membrane protein YfcC, ion transporter superfamily [Alteribacillus persepolensis]